MDQYVLNIKYIYFYKLNLRPFRTSKCCTFVVGFMATIKVVLRQKPNKKGEYPLALRITKDRKSSFLHTDIFIKAGEWDEIKETVRKNHPNSVRLNNLLHKKLSEAKDILIDFESKQKPYSLHAVKEKVSGRFKPYTFFDFADEYFQTMLSAGSYQRKSAEQPAISHFKRFLGNRTIEFIDITFHMLEKFRADLKGKQQLGERTTVNYLMVIRTIYNRAIKAGLIDKVNYPFGDNGLKLNRPASQKIGLSIDQIKKLETAEFKNKVLDHARNRFLFSFYLAGMRVSDLHLLRWSDFKNSRLYYVMRKNSKPLSIKIPDKAQAILEIYLPLKRDKDDFVFPEFKDFTELSDKIALQKQLHYRTAKLDEYLKKIGKQLSFDQKLTMHVARHSYASISGDKIPIQRLQQLYRHSSILTTIGYQYSFMFKGSDEALDTVLDY